MSFSLRNLCGPLRPLR